MIDYDTLMQTLQNAEATQHAEDAARSVEAALHRQYVEGVRWAVTDPVRAREWLASLDR